MIAFVLNQSSFSLCFCSSHSRGSLKKTEEFSRKVEMSKVESFTEINSAIKAFLLNWSSFSICVLFHQFRGAALITFSIKHCCIVGQKKLSRRTEDSKIKSFSWNEFTSGNSCFESKQFFYCPSVLLLSS